MDIGWFLVFNFQSYWFFLVFLFCSNRSAIVITFVLVRINQITLGDVTVCPVNPEQF